VVNRSTSHERDITASSFTWTARPGLSHGEIRRSLRLERDEVTLKGRVWAGSPLLQFLPGQLRAMIRLAIYECVVDSAGIGASVVQVFAGEVSKCPFDGPEFAAAASGLYSLFDRPAFPLRIQRTCNATVFSPLCGLVAADWTFTATVVSATATTLTLGSFSRPGGLPAGFGFEHWFALGVAQRTVAGVPERHLIAGSTAIDGNGRIVLTLSRVIPGTVQAGDTWTVLPGCDGYPETCRAWHTTTNPKGKFNHFADFKGFPEMPDKDPAFQPLKKSDSAAGKK
jgi:uncharacterized phage protein (TIGR02218 family)